MLKFEDETYRIRGAIYEVYREMGWGFLEAVYQECLEREFTRQQVPFVAQWELTLCYKGEQLIHTYRPDFICFDKIIVEIKAVKDLANEHEAQLHNYMRASGLKCGLLVNFGSYPGTQIKRVVY